MFTQSPDSKPSAELNKILSKISELPRNLVFKREALSRRPDWKYERNYLLPSQNLGECACEHGFNRSASNQRAKAEALIIQKIENKFPVKMMPKLRYVSLGAGYLLQDFIICAKLIAKGYSLEVTLIEPESGLPASGQPDQNYMRFQAALSEFKSLESAAAQRGLTFSVECFSSVMSFITKKPDYKADYMNAVDLGSEDIPVMYDDLILAYQMLHDDGIFYLSIGDREYFYDKNRMFHSKDNALLGWNALIDQQAKLMVDITKQSLAQENELCKVMKIPSANISKTILLYTGIFKQGPLIELLEKKEAKDVVLKAKSSK
jgi:hypothetical protein